LIDGHVDLRHRDILFKVRNLEGEMKIIQLRSYFNLTGQPYLRLRALHPDAPDARSLKKPAGLRRRGLVGSLARYELRDPRYSKAMADSLTNSGR
jgi:hypothetical protein